VLDDNTNGVLKLSLHSNGYTWKFCPSRARPFTDEGTRLSRAPAR